MLRGTGSGSSPPKHRHDGTSPLPLGIDWSPPPKKWNGRDTIWPHDPRTGWSYCVTLPSWAALPKSRSGTSDPVVFYRVQVGIQSPAGVTTTRGVLRRFNDFLKLFSDLKKAFPKKSLPAAPPKGLLRMKSRALLEERRRALEEWILKLLSDIDISRSVAVASFLELEAATRSSFIEANQQPSDADTSTNSSTSSHQIHPSLSFPVLAGSSSMTSDYGSDTAYETSELGSPSLGRGDGSELGLDELTLDEDLTSPVENLAKYSISNIDEALLMGESILDQLESLKKHKVHVGKMTNNGSASKPVPLSLLEEQQSKLVNHSRKTSNESIGSDFSSYRGSEMSNSWAPNFPSEASFDLPSVAEGSEIMGSPGSPEMLYGGPVVLPRSQQPNLNRILMIMQRRLVTAKTDMEDLITRLNQEVAVKEYLTSKVKDLEGELETSKEKYKENLQQALSLEKERITKMQWDMEELRRRSLEMEWKLKSQEDGKLPTESTSAFADKNEFSRELKTTKDQLNILLKQHGELEVKSKSDIKVLVKEVKSLRKSHNALTQKLDESLQEKLKVEQLLQYEVERNELAVAARQKLLHDCQTLQIRLHECNVKLVDNNFATNSSISHVFDLLAESDKQLSLLLAETKNLAPEDNTTSNSEEMKTLDRELRLVLRDVFTSNAKVRKRANFLIRSLLQIDKSTDEDGNQDGETALSPEYVIKQFFETY